MTADMTNNAPTDDCHRPAGAGPVHRQVRAPHPERAAFEAWALPILGDNPTWRESGSCELAWQVWQAARPQRAAVGRLVNVAAVLTSPSPMRKLWQLEEEAGRTLGRRALSDALADSDERLKALAIELAALARAL